MGAMSSPDLPSDLTPAELTAEDIQACLKVLDSIHAYDEEHPDYVSVRRATGKMFKAVKRHRRVTKKDLIAEADRAVISQTATAAPDRIDDETRGNKLAPSATGEIAGHLIKSRPCYVCKQHFTQVDAFAQSSGGVATVFARKGDDFERVTTSLKNEKGVLRVL